MKDYWKKRAKSNPAYYAVCAYLLLPLLMAFLFRKSIRRTHYRNENWFNRGFWYLLKDDFHKKNRPNGSTNYNYLDYGEEYWIDTKWFLSKPGKWSAFWWMVRNNAWNKKLSELLPEMILKINEEKIERYPVKIVSDALYQGDKKASVFNSATIRYKTGGNSGKVNDFDYENTVRGKAEVYYTVNDNSEIHCRKSEVKTLIMLPFGYQLASEMHSGNNSMRYVYRYKWKLIKHSEKL